MRPTVLPGPPPALPAPARAWTWPSRLDAKQDMIDEVVAAIAAAGALDDEARTWLVLCLDEAFVNAMLHGNEGDPDLAFTVGLWTGPDGWSLRVADRGTGFVPEEVPDCDDPASLLLEHGRGIRLMHAWLDRVVWYDGGATLTMARGWKPGGPA